LSFNKFFNNLKQIICKSVLLQKNNLGLKMKKILLLLVIALPFILTSCKDDDNPTNTDNGGGANTSIMPTTKGSWWVNDDYMVDTNGVTSSSPVSSSTVTNGNNITKEGKSCIEQITTFKDPETNKITTQTNYVAVEGNKVYIFGEQVVQGFSLFIGLLLGGEGGGSNIDFSNVKWLKVADKDASSWTMAEIPVELKDITIPGFSLPGSSGSAVDVKGKITMTGVKKGSTSVTIKGKQHTAQQYDMEIKFTADISTNTGFGKSKVATAEFSTVNSTWFSDGVGVVRAESVGSTTNVKLIPLLGGASLVNEVDKSGSKSILLDYQIK
jgi:hypothetical protein